MRHCLFFPGLEWSFSISKSLWEPSQGYACGLGLAGILALSLMRGDPEVYRTACLEKLWHLTCVAHSQTTLNPREGILKGNLGPLTSLPSKNQLRARLEDSFLYDALLLPVKSCSGQPEPLPKCICVWSLKEFWVVSGSTVGWQGRRPGLY